MTVLYAAFLLAMGSPQEIVSDPFAQTRFTSVVDNQERILLHIPTGPLQTPKMSPLHDEWYYAFTVSGMGRPGRESQFNQRFRVFAQRREKLDDDTYNTARMLMRLWDYNVQKLTLDHSSTYQRTVDVYMSEGGKAGGEQRIAFDEQEPDGTGRAGRVNTIHIYDIKSFTDPMQKAREVAHEYGHATLPNIGGYDAPESYANGDVGERIYLRWLYEDMEKGTVGWLDTLGAKKEAIAAYLKDRVDPLIRRMALNGPDQTVLNRTDKAAFMEYVALTCYMEEIMPLNVFRRYMLLTGDGHGREAWPEAINAPAEVEQLTITPPADLKTTAIWIPLGKGQVQTGRVQAKRGSWAKVMPASGKIVVKNPPVQ